MELRASMRAIRQELQLHSGCELERNRLSLLPINETRFDSPRSTQRPLRLQIVEAGEQGEAECKIDSVQFSTFNSSRMLCRRVETKLEQASGERVVELCRQVVVVLQNQGE